MLSPTEGTAGTQVNISGSGFTAGHTIWITWEKDATLLANPSAGIDGTISVSFKVPANTTPDSYSISIADRSNHEFIYKTFKVTASSQPPVDNPTENPQATPTSTSPQKVTKRCDQKIMDGKLYSVCYICTEQQTGSPICTTTQDLITSEPAKTETPKTQPSATDTQLQMHTPTLISATIFPIKRPTQKQNEEPPKKLQEKPNGSDKKVDKQTRRKLFILLQGINTQLTQEDIDKYYKPGFDQKPYRQFRGGISYAIRKKYPDADIFSYSYKGVDSKGKLKPYSCEATFIFSLKNDVYRLNEQINNYLKKYPNTDIYLIGHSLGGVVAFSYLTALTQHEEEFSLPPNSKLKTVATLDSPIGGVPPKYSAFVNVLFVQGFDNYPICESVGTTNTKTVDDLLTIYSTIGSPWSNTNNFYGSSASIWRAIFRGENEKFNNYDVALKAKKEIGTTTLISGNLNDFLWNPQSCIDYLNFLPAWKISSVFNFNSTQWLISPDKNNSIQNIVFSSGSDTCIISLVDNLNHHMALTDQKTIRELMKIVSR